MFWSVSYFWGKLDNGPFDLLNPTALKAKQQKTKQKKQQLRNFFDDAFWRHKASFIPTFNMFLQGSVSLGNTVREFQVIWLLALALRWEKEEEAASRSGTAWPESPCLNHLLPHRVQVRNQIQSEREREILGPKMRRKNVLPKCFLVNETPIATGSCF